MEYFIIPIIACCASLLTFFSGFGLGTLLLPVVALFFPLPVAVIMTACVHLLSNFFKLILIGKHADKKIVWRFGIPALIGSVMGAFSLIFLLHIPTIATYHLWGHLYSIQILNIVIGVLLIVFTTLEAKKEKITFAPPKHHALLIGGLLSGFFGGLSGFQGALRSLFLIKYTLTKEAFVATGIAIACMVDIARIPTYGFSLPLITLENNITLFSVTVLAAFVGAYLGNIFLKRIPIHFIKTVMSALIYIISVGLIIGIV
ncbi:MAG: hypothetical protein ACD_60C00133G0010 [uncultured bacterium]|nr:MAG: hypothetical protein ACD_60C00133G0010 [uncultured bacterium]